MQIERVSRLEELYNHITNESFLKLVKEEVKNALGENAVVNENTSKDLFTLSMRGYGNWCFQPYTIERFKRWIGNYGTVNICGDILYWDFQHMIIGESDWNIHKLIDIVRVMCEKGVTIHMRGLFIEDNCLYMCGYPSDDNAYMHICCAYSYVNSYCKEKNVSVSYNDSKYPLIRIPVFHFTPTLTHRDLRVFDRELEKWKECYFGTFQPYIWSFYNKKSECITTPIHMPAMIAHRGLLKGPDSSIENKVECIKRNCMNGIISEIDIWYENGLYKIGHDSPGDEISYDFLYNYRQLLLIHSKNVDTFAHFHELRYHKGIDFHYFYHTEEEVVYTSRGYIIPYPGVTVHNGWIHMMPENKKCIGSIVKRPAMICTDYSKGVGEEL
jgi:hypothetical protein